MTELEEHVVYVFGCYIKESEVSQLTFTTYKVIGERGVSGADIARCQLVDYLNKQGIVVQSINELPSTSALVPKT